MRRHLAVVAVALVAAASVGAQAGGGGQEATAEQVQGTTPAVPVELVSTAVVRPHKTRVVRSKFRPWVHPTYPQVQVIAHAEAVLWGAPEWRLMCRIHGESGYRWWAANGQYKGLGQFASSTFARGVAAMGTRRVGYTKRWVVYRHLRLERRWSDGTVTHKAGRRMAVTIIHKYVGWIPHHPPLTHGWAQVRIMAQAMVGKGGVSDGEWQVRC